MSKILDIKKRIMQKKVSRKKKAAGGEEFFEVRDSRENGFFIIDDAYLNGFAKVCGIYGTLVYMALCRHAGKDQTCFPSVDLMATRLGTSKKSIMRGLKELEDHRVIRVDRKQGQPNIYELTNKRTWKKFIIAPGEPIKAVGKTMPSRLLRPCGECDNQGNEEVCLKCQSGTNFRSGLVTGTSP